MIDSIFNYIENSFIMHPTTIAISDGIDDITYSQLEEKIRIIENNLNKRIAYQDTVVIYFSRSISYIVLMASLVKMGVVYVPADVNTPLHIVTTIAKEVGAKYIITDQDIETADVQLLFWGDIEREHKRIVKEVMPSPVRAEDLVYIICTSGSSGESKGVMIEHRNLINLVTSLSHCVYQNRIDGNSCRIAVMAPFAFDASVKQIYMALCNGFTLIICPDKIKRFGRFAVDFLRKNRVNVVDITPSLLAVWALDKKAICYDELNLLLVGGELLREKHVCYAKNLFGDSVTIVNLYGPTECCVDVAYYVVPQSLKFENEDNILPIGLPLENLFFSLEQDSGELIVEGASVGRGYTGIPTKAFEVEDTGIRRYKTGDVCHIGRDGLYYILGRLDNQIKLHGYRIELDAIDNTIMKNPDTLASISFCVTQGARSHICSYVKTSSSVDQIKEYLRRELPSYMIPTYIYLIEGTVRVNNNGKLDKDFYKRQFRDNHRSF